MHYALEIYGKAAAGLPRCASVVQPAFCKARTYLYQRGYYNGIGYGSLPDGGKKIGTITRQCGLQSDNQLRQMIKKHTGRLPSAMRDPSPRDGSMRDTSGMERKSA